MRSPQQEAPPSTAFTRGVRKKDLVIREKQRDYSTLRGSTERHSLIMTLASLPLIPDVAMAPINTQGENYLRQLGALLPYCSENLVAFSGTTKLQREL